MLVRAGILYHHNPPTPQAFVTGRNIAHGHRTASERALLGADLKLGRISPTEFTFKQCAALVRVSVPYVTAAVLIAGDEGARAAVRSGLLTVLDAARRAGAESLAAHIARSSDEELREAARAVGPSVLWDRMIEPLLA